MFEKVIPGWGLTTGGGSNSGGSNSPVSGDVRWNHIDNAFEIVPYDSNQKYRVYPQVQTIEMDSDIQKLLLWVRDQKIKEDKLQKLVEKHSALKDIKEKYEIMLALCYQEEV